MKAFRILALASLALLVGEGRTRAQSPLPPAQSALPPAQEPQVADPSDRYAVYIRRDRVLPRVDEGV